MNALKNKQEEVKEEESKRQLKNTIVQFIQKNQYCSVYQLINAFPSPPHNDSPTLMYGIEEMNLLFYPIAMRSDIIVALNDLTRNSMIEMIPTSFMTYLLDGIHFGDDTPIASISSFLQHLKRNEAFQEEHWLPIAFCIGGTYNK
jgi:hypothetical protein